MNLTYVLQGRLPVPDKAVCRRVRILTGYACNLRCSFCYYRDGLKGFFAAKDVKSEMRKMSESGMTSFDFSGGEPTIHPDFLELVKYGKELKCRVSCVTNGLKLSDSDFSKKCFDCGLSEVLVSIHGLRDDHERITGKSGSFDKAVACARNCSSLGMKVRVNCTLEYNNYTNLNEYLELMAGIGVSQVNFIVLNYNDYAKNFEPVPVQEICASLNSLDLSGLDLDVNVRYVPYCLVTNPEIKVVNYYDHIFDETDWAPLYSYFDEGEILSDEEIVKRTVKKFQETLPAKYFKPGKCLKCKMYSRCDGLKNNDRKSADSLVPLL